MRSSRGVSRWYCQHHEEIEDHEHRAFETDLHHGNCHNEPSRRDPASFRERQRQEHVNDTYERFFDPSHVDHTSRLAPLRVAELRGGFFESSTERLPASSSLQPPCVSLSNLPAHQPSHHVSGERVTISGRPRDELWAGNFASSNDRWGERRARTESYEMYHQVNTSPIIGNDVFRPRSSSAEIDVVSCQLVTDGSWESPSSFRSSPDGASYQAERINGWNGLRNDSPGLMSPQSESRAHSTSLQNQPDEQITGEAKSKAARSATSAKQSRYLREMDRRIILSRLAKGERQAALAKEYGVSRSTICNLLKQRDFVLARKNENPMSRHPKKNRLLKAKLATSQVGVLTQPIDSVVRPSSRTNDDSDDWEQKRAKSASQTGEFLSFDDTMVIEVQSRAISVLKTKLLNRETSDSDFERCYTRLMRLLMEEAIGTVAARAQNNPFKDGTQSQLLQQPPPRLVEGLCAVAIGESGTPLLDIFRLLEPEVCTGFIGASFTESEKLELHIVSHPNDLDVRDILLLDIVLASGDRACAAIELLRATGVREDRITIVAVFIAAEAVALVQYAHPSVRILTAGIDMQLHQRVGKGGTEVESSSSSRVFLARVLALVK